jgi:hypothetical protein
MGQPSRENFTGPVTFSKSETRSPACIHQIHQRCGSRSYRRSDDATASQRGYHRLHTAFIAALRHCGVGDSSLFRATLRSVSRSSRLRSSPSEVTSTQASARLASNYRRRVNYRGRAKPRLPKNLFGNMVLWCSMMQLRDNLSSRD